MSKSKKIKIFNNQIEQLNSIVNKLVSELGGKIKIQKQVKLENKMVVDTI